MSLSLKRWYSADHLSDGDLILAWVNLGALVEGTLKLFLCVYLNDYLNSDSKDKPKDKNREKIPNEFKLEDLKNYIRKIQLFKTNPGILMSKKSSWLAKEYSKSLLLGQNDFDSFIDKVQQRRNAIHAFKPRDIGTLIEFKQCVVEYWKLLEEVHNSLPYP